VRIGLSLAGITVVVVMVGIGSRRFYVPDHRPQPGEPIRIGSPQARAEGPTTGGEPR
jgi:hypothetical protein